MVGSGLLVSIGQQVIAWTTAGVHNPDGLITLGNNKLQEAKIFIFRLPKRQLIRKCLVIST